MKKLFAISLILNIITCRAPEDVYLNSFLKRLAQQNTKSEKIAYTKRELETLTALFNDKNAFVSKCQKLKKRALTLPNSQKKLNKVKAYRKGAKQQIYSISSYITALQTSLKFIQIIENDHSSDNQVPQAYTQN